MFLWLLVEKIVRSMVRRNEKFFPFVPEKEEEMDQGSWWT
jgi:hypothetical protein